MSKRRDRNATAISAQLALIDTGLAEGALDIGLGLKQLLSRQLQGLDRWIIAAQISKSTGIEISKDTLDKRLSSDPAYQMYAVHMTAVSQMIGNLKPFQYLLEPLGSDVLNPEDKDLIELARLQEQAKVIETKILTIRQKRGIK
jgi:hypothetical protein